MKVDYGVLDDEAQAVIIQRAAGVMRGLQEVWRDAEPGGEEEAGLIALGQGVALLTAACCLLDGTAFEGPIDMIIKAGPDLVEEAYHQ